MHPKFAIPILAAVALAGQPPPTFEIRGVVVDAGTNQTVAGARIALSVQTPGPVKFNGAWQPDDSRQCATDERGAFTLTLDKPGAYRVEAKKEGYRPPGARGPREFAEAALTPGEPAADVKLFLATPGRLTGTVVDEETGKPIANLRLKAVQGRFRSAWFPETATARTGPDGGFVLSGLSPGDYAVVVGRQTEQRRRIRTTFTEKDAAAVDLDFETTWWPGGRGPDVVQPSSLPSGATLNVGVLGVKKGPYYRVHVRVPASNCQPGDTMRVGESLVIPGGISHLPLGQAPCGKDFLITGYPPGNYRLSLTIDNRTAENRGTASVPFVVVDENLQIDAPLHLGVTVDGVCVPVAGAKAPDFSKLRVMLYAVDSQGSPDQMLNVPIDDEGKFRLEHVRPLAHWVSLTGLVPPHYVKEMRYNGISLTGNLAPLDVAAPANSLTIVMDDQAGAIVGTVVADDRPVTQAFVLASKWPLTAFSPTMVGWGRARADDTGSFQMTGLAPGEYRVVAVRSVTQGTTIASIEQALAAGTKVEIGPSEVRNLRLNLAELR